MNRAYLFYVLRFLSDRNVDRGGRRVRAAIFAVALAMIPFVTVIEVSGGMIAGITSRYLEIGSFHLQVRLFGDLEDEEVDELVSALMMGEGVEEAFVVYEGVGLVHTPEKRIGVSVRAYPYSVVAQDEGFREYLRFEGEFTAEGVALSGGVLSELGIGVGETIGIVVARTLPNGRFALKQHEGVVTATFTTGYADLDAHLILVSEQTGRELFPSSTGRFVAVKVTDPFRDLTPLVRRLQSIMPAGAYVYSWRELERGMYTTFQTTRSLLIIIMGVIVGVAAITISSGLIALVAERELEIGLLRALGATSGNIQRSFLLLGTSAGAIGALAGVGGGLFVSLRVNELFQIIERVIALVQRNRIQLGQSSEALKILDPAFYLERIPITPGLVELIAIVFASILLATLSAWLPARRAGNVEPAEVLQRH